MFYRTTPSNPNHLMNLFNNPNNRPFLSGHNLTSQKNVGFESDFASDEILDTPTNLSPECISEFKRIWISKKFFEPQNNLASQNHFAYQNNNLTSQNNYTSQTILNQNNLASQNNLAYQSNNLTSQNNYSSQTILDQNNMASHNNMAYKNYNLTLQNNYTSQIILDQNNFDSQNNCNFQNILASQNCIASQNNLVSQNNWDFQNNLTSQNNLASQNSLPSQYKLPTHNLTHSTNSIQSKNPQMVPNHSLSKFPTIDKYIPDILPSAKSVTQYPYTAVGSSKIHDNHPLSNTLPNADHLQICELLILLLFLFYINV